MVCKLGYDSYVKRLNSATVAATCSGRWCMDFLTAVLRAHAQINGTPASVTSTNFGGHLNSTPGVPASITSLGPNGIQPRNPFPNQPPCCINPLFPVNPNPPVNQRHLISQRGQFFPGGGAVYVPYAYPVVGESDPGDAVADQQGNQPEEDYRGGPTIFDRRGPGAPARSHADAYPPPTSPPDGSRGSSSASAGGNPGPRPASDLARLQRRPPARSSELRGDWRHALRLDAGTPSQDRARRSRPDFHRETERRSRH